MPAVGDRIGEFKLTDTLGEGGFGSVWVAQSARLNREVAVKILHHELIEERVSEEGPTVADRFLAEARLLQRLHHPGFCTIYSVIEDRKQNIVAYAMERLVGSDLSICAKSLSLGELLEVFAKTADTLSYLHDNGMIHRDIKAENIFITAPGGHDNAVKQVKLLDFGVAKELHAEGKLLNTATGVFLASVNSMPPESFHRWEEGEEQLRPSIDQWSLGVTLYQCLTGKMPFSGNTLVELMISIENEPYENFELLPRFDRPVVPEDLLELIDNCLAKNPSQRYPTMRALAQAFRATAHSLGQMEGTVMSSTDFLESTATSEPAVDVTSLLSDAFTSESLGETNFSMGQRVTKTKPAEVVPLPGSPSFRVGPQPDSDMQIRSRPSAIAQELGVKVPPQSLNEDIPNPAGISFIRKQLGRSHSSFVRAIKIGKSSVRVSVIQFYLWLLMIFVLGFMTCYLVFGFRWGN